MNNETKASRVQNLVDRFVKICESEDREDIAQSVIIFLSAIHLQEEDDSIPLERHAENLKQDFINTCKNAKKLTELLMDLKKLDKRNAC